MKKTKIYHLFKTYINSMMSRLKHVPTEILYLCFAKRNLKTFTEILYTYLIPFKFLKT